MPFAGQPHLSLRWASLAPPITISALGKQDPKKKTKKKKEKKSNVTAARGFPPTGSNWSSLHEYSPGIELGTSGTPPVSARPVANPLVVFLPRVATSICFPGKSLFAIIQVHFFDPCPIIQMNFARRDQMRAMSHLLPFKSA